MSNYNIPDQNLKWYRGDTQDLVLEFVDEYDNPIDITDWTIFFTVKENLNQSDEEAIISKTVTTHSNPTLGQTIVSISSSDSNYTGNYMYDIQVKTDEGDIKTILNGRLNFSKDVTQRTS